MPQKRCSFWLTTHASNEAFDQQSIALVCTVIIHRHMAWIHKRWLDMVHGVCKFECVNWRDSLRTQTIDLLHKGRANHEGAQVKCTLISRLN